MDVYTTLQSICGFTFGVYNLYENMSYLETNVMPHTKVCIHNWLCITTEEKLPDLCD